MQFVTIKELADSVFRDILGENAMPANIGGMESKKTRKFHFAETGIDKYVGALQAGKIYTVGGRPGMGKTTFLLKQAIDNAANSGFPVFVFQGEMSNQQIIERMIPIVTGMENDELEDARYVPEHRKTMENAWNVLRELPIYFLPYDISTDFHIEGITADSGIFENSLLIFDYFQLMECSNDGRCWGIEYNMKVTTELHRIAEECASPVIVATQLPRSVEAREDKLPLPEDIPQPLLQASEAVILLTRKSVYGDYSSGDAVTAILRSDLKSPKTITFAPYFKSGEKRTVDCLEFRLIDPKVAGEDWALNWGNGSDVVEIYINGREIVPVLKRIENRIKDPDDSCPAGDYGHISAKELLENLQEAADPNTEYHNHGAELLCCLNCGMSGCWSVLARVDVGWNYVTWTLSHNHRDWDYGLKFTFSKYNYNYQLQYLQYEGNPFLHMTDTVSD